jgi:uncharacterized protein YlaI
MTIICVLGVIMMLLLIVHTINMSKIDIDTRLCKFCGGVRHNNGVCLSCGNHAKCCMCGKVRTIKGRWVKMHRLWPSMKGKATHTLCNDCTKRLYPQESTFMFGGHGAN